MAVSEVRHTAVTNSKNSVLSGRIESVLSMKITQALLDDLTAHAERLNAIEPGSPLPIHRHRKSSETVVCLRGRLMEEFYDELERRCTGAIELSPGGPVVALNIPIGQWHTVRALESGTVIMEVKDGPYEPTGEEDILAL